MSLLFGSSNVSEDVTRIRTKFEKISSDDRDDVIRHAEAKKDEDTTSPEYWLQKISKDINRTIHKQPLMPKPFKVLDLMKHRGLLLKDNPHRGYLYVHDKQNYASYIMIPFDDVTVYTERDIIRFKFSLTGSGVSFVRIENEGKKASINFIEGTDRDYFQEGNNIIVNVELDEVNAAV